MPSNHVEVVTRVHMLRVAEVYFKLFNDLIGNYNSIISLTLSNIPGVDQIGMV